MATAEESPLAEDDVDRTDFTEEHLKAENDMGPLGSHSDVEPASLLPDISDGKVAIGTTNHLLVSLANMGAKMFNITHIDGTAESSAGGKPYKFKKLSFGQSLGPREQRSFRFPFTPSEELVSAGEYTVAFKVYYQNREKDKFVDVVYNETLTMVPKPLSIDATEFIPYAVGSAIILLLVFLASSFGSKGSKSTKAPAKAAAASSGNEWLAGTLAGVEGKSPKKKSKRK